MAQLSALYTNSSESPVPIIDVSDVHQNVFLDSLGKLFATLITLDNIIGNQTTLRDHWAAYKRVIKAAQFDPGKFGLEKEKVVLLRKLLAPTEAGVLDGNLFKVCNTTTICQKVTLRPGFAPHKRKFSSARCHVCFSMPGSK